MGIRKHFYICTLKQYWLGFFLFNTLINFLVWEKSVCFPSKGRKTCGSFTPVQHLLAYFWRSRESFSIEKELLALQEVHFTWLNREIMVADVFGCYGFRRNQCQQSITRDMCPEVTARLYLAWLYIMSIVLCTHQGSGCFLHIQNEFSYISSVMDSLHGLLHLKER